MAVSVDRSSGQFPTSKRDRNTWQAWGCNKRTTTIRPSTECLRHPTSDQALKTSGSTPTCGAWHHLRSGTQEFGYNPHSSASTSPQIKQLRARVQLRLVGPNITSRTTDGPDSPSTLKLLEDSSSTAQRRDSQNYQIRFQLRRLNKSHLQLTDLISGQQILSPANRSGGYSQQIK